MSIIVDDPLDGPGGKGYSWFRLEVVSEHVPLPYSYYDIHLKKPRMTITGVYNPLIAVSEALKRTQARTGTLSPLYSGSWIDKLMRIVSWIRKEE